MILKTKNNKKCLRIILYIFVLLFICIVLGIQTWLDFFEKNDKDLNNESYFLKQNYEKFRNSFRQRYCSE